MKTIIRVILLAGLAAPATTFAQVPYDRIVKAESEPANWLTYAGSYKSQRYTQLDQINKQNVTQLKPAWVYQLRTGGVFETSPVVVDGVMYMTEPPSTVTAIDVRTGRPLWSWTPKIPDDVIVIGSPPVNRGVAVLDNMVYAGSIAGHLAALDAKSGALRWDVAVDDNKIGYYLTLAPLAIDGKIIVGVSGAENGIRGFVDAYDAKTGKRVWRRHTIPAPGEPGNETWGGKDSWKTGGGSTWLTGSYDPRTEAAVLAGRQPGTRLERRFSSGRQSLHLFRPRHQPGRWQPEVDVSVHAARHARLGRERNGGAVRRDDQRPAPQAADAGEPQRLLLRARSRDRGIHHRHAVRETDVGRRTGREGPAHHQAGSRSESRRHPRVSEHSGRRELARAELQPEDRPLLPDRGGDGDDLLQGRSGVQAGHRLHGRRRPHRSTATMRGARFAPSKRRPAS